MQRCITATRAWRVGGDLWDRFLFYTDKEPGAGGGGAGPRLDCGALSLARRDLRSQPHHPALLFLELKLTCLLSLPTAHLLRGQQSAGPQNGAGPGALQDAQLTPACPAQMPSCL